MIPACLTLWSRRLGLSPAKQSLQTQQLKSEEQARKTRPDGVAVRRSVTQQGNSAT